MHIKMKSLSLISYGLFIYLVYLAAHMVLNVLNSPMTEWSLSELLVNYQGGFVRRGLIGEILFQSDNPIALAHSLQRFFVAIFIFGVLVVLILEREIPSKLLLLALVTFASGGILDFASGGNFEYLDRKEIWFYSVLGLIFVSTRIFGFFDLKNILVINFLSVLMTLHHELYAMFFLPLMLLIASLSGAGYLLKSIALIVPTFITLLIVTINSGDQSTANLINESYKLKYGINVGMAIYAIGWSFERSHELSLRAFTQGSLLYWLYHMVVNLIFLTIFAAYKGKTIREFFVYMAIIFIVLCVTVFAMYAGWDWGRWISMLVFMSIFYIYIVNSALSNVDHTNFANTLNKEMSNHFRTQIVSVMLLCFLIGLNMNVRIGICCIQPNYLEFVKTSIERPPEGLD